MVTLPRTASSDSVGSAFSGASKGTQSPSSERMLKRPTASPIASSEGADSDVGSEESCVSSALTETQTPSVTDIAMEIFSKRCQGISADWGVRAKGLVLSFQAQLFTQQAQLLTPRVIEFRQLLVDEKVLQPMLNALIELHSKIDQERSDIVNKTVNDLIGFIRRMQANRDDYAAKKQALLAEQENQLTIARSVVLALFFLAVLTWIGKSYGVILNQQKES